MLRHPQSSRALDLGSCCRGRGGGGVPATGSGWRHRLELGALYGPGEHAAQAVAARHRQSSPSVRSNTASPVQQLPPVVQPPCARCLLGACLSGGCHARVLLLRAPLRLRFGRFYADIQHLVGHCCVCLVPCRQLQQLLHPPWARGSIACFLFCRLACPSWLCTRG
jgi:hypothetical protein